MNTVYLVNEKNIGTEQPTLTQMQNVEFLSNGTIRARRGYKTFKGMVYQLWLINKRYSKLGVQGDFTVRLPLKSGGYNK